MALTSAVFLPRCRLPAWLLMAAAGLLQAGIAWGQAAVPPVPASAETHLVALRDTADRKAVFATVESIDTLAARARIGGTVEALSVDEGSRVESGQPIARIADPKLRLERAAIEARIESLRAQRDLARLSLDRAEELRRSGAATQARLDEARTDVNVIDKNLAALAAERDLVIQRQAEGVVAAPDGGRVLEVRVADGSVVLAGETVAMIAADSYVLRLHLPERHARLIKVGDRVLVGARGLQADAGPLGNGRIRQVYPRLEQGRVVADVEVAGLGDFFVGERVRVEVATDVRPVLVVPAAFLDRRYGLTFARLSGGADVVVQTGAVLEQGVEVLTGLRPGDVLIRPDAGR